MPLLLAYRSRVILFTGLALACGRSEGADIGTPIVALDPMPSPAGAGSAEPNLSAGAAGRVYLSWLEPQPDSEHALRFAILEDGAWSEARTIETRSDFFVNWADFPSLVELPDGRLAVHWLQKNGEGKYSYDVRIAQSRDAGITWSSAVVPHRDATPTEHGFVSLFAVADSVAVVWLDGRAYDMDGPRSNNEMQLAYTTIDRDGRLGAERILDRRICDCCQTAMALTSRGPVVVYRDRSADEIRDIALVRLVGGRWTEPAPVHDDGWFIPACPVNGPAVAARGDLVAAAWFTGARDTARVLVAFSTDAGVTFGPPTRVDAGHPAGRVAVVLDDIHGGRALVSWIERSGGDSAQVLVRQVALDGESSEAVAIGASTAGRASGFPRMARSGDTIVFAWTEPGAPSAVRVARARLPRDRSGG